MNVGEWIEDLLFRGDAVSFDYWPFPIEGAFPARLLKWLKNCRGARERIALLRLADRLIYLDGRAVRSLYSSAYRQLAVPWLLRGSLNPAVEVTSGFWNLALDALAAARVFSVTDSFHWDNFRSVNNIAGIQEPKALGKTISQIRTTLGTSSYGAVSVLVFEDVVGSGDQVIRALTELLTHCNRRTRLHFIALIGLEGAEKTISDKFGSRITVSFVSTIPLSACVRERKTGDVDDRETAAIRAVVQSTAERVCTRLDKLDDPPSNSFGYRGAGATIVTYRNAPNNTLPLIHHKAPEWSPLFRRIHHGEREI